MLKVQHVLDSLLAGVSVQIATIRAEQALARPDEEVVAQHRRSNDFFDGPSESSMRSLHAVFAAGAAEVVKNLQLKQVWPGALPLSLLSAAVPSRTRGPSYLFGPRPPSVVRRIAGGAGGDTVAHGACESCLRPILCCKPRRVPGGVGSHSRVHGGASEHVQSCIRAPQKLARGAVCSRGVHGMAPSSGAAGPAPASCEPRGEPLETGRSCSASRRSPHGRRNGVRAAAWAEAWFAL